MLNGMGGMKADTHKAVVKRRIEMEKVLETKQILKKKGKENEKPDLTYLGAGRWVYWVE